MPVERHFVIPESPQRQPLVSFDDEGNLVVHPPQVINDGDDDALADFVWEVVSILRRIGGTIQIGSQRAEIARNVVVTESYVAAYNSFTPLVRKLAEQAPAEEGGLSAEELEQHFPNALGDAIEAAQDEEPATAPEAEQELERAGTVLE